MEPLSLTTYLALGVITGAIGAYVSEQKGRSHRFGFWIGFLFGFIGVLGLLMLRKQKKD